MKITTLQETKIIGISVRTTNGHGQAAKDIPALWGRFMREEILKKIPGKLNNHVYSVYTDYESDYIEGYTTIIGCAVAANTDVPAGMVSTQIVGGKYLTSSHRGDLTKGAVINEWKKIWERDHELDRNYQSDYEVYNDEVGDPTNSSFEIFIGIN